MNRPLRAALQCVVLAFGLLWLAAPLGHAQSIAPCPQTGTVNPGDVLVAGPQTTLADSCVAPAPNICQTIFGHSDPMQPPLGPDTSPAYFGLAGYSGGSGAVAVTLPEGIGWLYDLTVWVATAPPAGSSDTVYLNYETQNTAVGGVVTPGQNLLVDADPSHAVEVNGGSFWVLYKAVGGAAGSRYGISWSVKYCAGHP
ncbi:MAG TPA: hypothetical protein VFA12_20045 [Stellaceae bacterium]|nr:hypothetical protein [Stellaceae bacterium]